MSNTIEMSIQDALQELKLIDKRIQQKQNSIIAVTIGYATPATDRTKADQAKFQTEANANYQSLQALFERYATIKGAIVASNASTIVTIGGKEYTVAAAIEQKTRIKYQQELVKRLYTQLSEVTRQLERKQAEYEVRRDKYVTENSQSGNTTITSKEELSASFDKLNLQVILDPLDLKVNLVTLQNDIDTFQGSVNNVLTASNVLTKVQVPA